MSVKKVKINLGWQSFIYTTYLKKKKKNTYIKQCVYCHLKSKSYLTQPSLSDSGQGSFSCNEKYLKKIKIKPKEFCVFVLMSYNKTVNNEKTLLKL